MVMHATLKGFTHHETCRPFRSKSCTQQKLESPCAQLQPVQLTAAKSALQDRGLLLTPYVKHGSPEYRVLGILVPFLRRSSETLACFAQGSGESGYSLDCRKRGVNLQDGTTKGHMWSVLSYCRRALDLSSASRSGGLSMRTAARSSTSEPYNLFQVKYCSWLALCLSLHHSGSVLQLNVLAIVNCFIY